MEKFVRPIIAILTILMSFGLLASILFFPLQNIAKEIVIFILGLLSGSIKDILSFYYGSSDDNNKQYNEKK